MQPHVVVSYDSQFGPVIFAGDFNAQFDTIPSSSIAKKKSEIFKDFLHVNSLVPVNKMNLCAGKTYTFSTLRTTIDYVLVPETFRDCVSTCEVFSTADTDIASDHLPIYCVFAVPVVRYDINNIARPPCFGWNKAKTEHLINYQLQVDCNLAPLLEIDDIYSVEYIDFLNEAIINVLLSASYEAIPYHNYNSNLKPYWTVDVRNAHKAAREKRAIWINEGRPRGMDTESYKNYKHAKRCFINTQTDAYNEYQDKVFREIDEAAECDIRYFWKLWNGQNKKRSATCKELRIENVTLRNPIDIANEFSQYYSKISDSTEGVFAESFGGISNEVENEMLNGDFTIEEIDTAVKSLKLNKSPGVDRINNEHLRYAGRSLLMLLTKLFNAIFSVGYIPKTWKKGLIVPIYKGGSKPTYKCESYRPIALLCAFYKLFEKLILTRVQSWISTFSIDFPNKQQQGFTKSLNCVTTSFTLSETIWSALESDSTVFAAFLDIKRAFDTVWHSGLMKKLKSLGIKGHLLRIINQCYLNVESAVLLNGVSSTWFPVKRGVRQGGVLSTFLYKLFIDDLLNQLVRPSVIKFLSPFPKKLLTPGF